MTHVLDEPIRTKSRMYWLLSRGLLGNTIEQFFSLVEWETSSIKDKYPLWGVRTLTPGGPCRMHCPTEEVEATIRSFQPHAIHISAMIDWQCVVTLWADVYDTDTGLIVYGIERPARGDNWRKRMPVDGREWRGANARFMLHKHLNANSLADLYALLERYPCHVVELSACEENVGVIPYRNAVVWEVRQY